MDLRRADARLWIGADAAEPSRPAGLLVFRGADAVLVEQQAGRAVDETGVALVWQLDTGAARLGGD